MTQRIRGGLVADMQPVAIWRPGAVAAIRGIDRPLSIKEITATNSNSDRRLTTSREQLRQRFHSFAFPELLLIVGVV